MHCRVLPCTAMYCQAFKGVWGQSALGRIDMNYMSKMADSSVIMEAQKDPQARTCVCVCG